MALLDPRTERDIDNIIEASVGQFGVLITGQDPYSSIPTIFDPAQSGWIPPTTRAFLMGKASQRVGTESAKKLSDQGLIDMVATGQIALGPIDRLRMQTAAEATLKALKNQADDWKKKVRFVAEQQDDAWEAVLVGAGAGLAGMSLGLARQGQLTQLSSRVENTTEDLLASIDTFLQTELSAHLQSGTVSGSGPEEMVYKVPRPTAERHCLRLHVHANGTYRMYRLGDVMGASNAGVRAAEWQFTIGPVHPHCYCELHREADIPASSLSPLVPE